MTSLVSVSEEADRTLTVYKTNDKGMCRATSQALKKNKKKRYTHEYNNVRDIYLA